MTRRQLIAIYQQYDPHAQFVTFDDVLAGFQYDHPEWPPDAHCIHANRVFQDILTMDSDWHHSQEHFYQNVELSAYPHQRALGVEPPWQDSS